MSDFEYVFTDIQDDVVAQLDCSGEIPPELDGTFYTIGGAGTRVGTTALHAFDAHGRVTALRVSGKGGGGALKAKMVDTPLLRAEREQKRVTKRRLFTNKPARWSNLFDLDFGNNAWHNVLGWGDVVVAANNPGFFVLDRETLSTRGPAP